MKYSLRSLMTFSIRDLMWLTVVAAVSTCWWLHVRSIEIRQAADAQELNQVILKIANGAKDFLDGIHRANAPAPAPNTTNPPDEALLPNSSAPAPNPTKP